MNNISTASVTKEKPIAEITIKAVILAIIITAVLAAANAYLALKLGQTISASIPAAVIAMAALRLFKNHTILENNIVQTAASGGEGVAAAVCFVLPALVITGYWKYFHYWETALMTLVGGFLGVLFSIPLRRVMLNYPTLRFPEGTAIGNVVKASGSGAGKMVHLLQGSLVGAIIGLFQTGFKFLSDSLSLWTTTGQALYGFTIGFSPALIGAGFIVGMEACMAMLLGLVLAWVIGVPVYTLLYGLPQASNFMDMVMAVRADHLRYIGIGTMLFGGLWTLITLIKPIALGIYTSFQSLKITKFDTKVARIDRDIPISYVLIGSIILAILTYVSFLHFFHFKFETSGVLRFGLPLFSLGFVMIIGFLMAAICAYLSGLVGMTNNPLSGLLLGSVLLASVLLLPMIGHLLKDNPEALKSAITLVLITTTMVAIIIAISGENMQDLKAGQMVGATPWKQQVILMVGVIVAAFVVGPTLELLFQAYGIGGVFPRPGMDPTQMLAAPQAGLMETVASGTFGNSLPLFDIGVGVVIAMIAAVIDGRLKRKGHRLAILAIGIGIYLPPDITSAVIIGGALNYLCKRVVINREKGKSENPHAALERKFETPIMVCCGLVAGAALIGVILAIPFVIKGSSDALSLVPASFGHIADLLGLLGTVILCGWIYRITVRK